MSELYLGDCREVVKQFPDNLVDTIITDPPYGLEFMGKGWDKGVPGIEYWKEFLAVTKPGGMLLAFGGTRTYHRLACAIEDAGWEIRDCMMWLYGSGFPKSHNFKEGAFKGWGTALKPAWEPIIVAMKPLDGTFAQNAEKWGVAGINVDGGRIGTQVMTEGRAKKSEVYAAGNNSHNKMFKEAQPLLNPATHQGRWPANLLLDEDAAGLLDEQSGELKSGGGVRRPNGSKSVAMSPLAADDISEWSASAGGASRFFYCSKASKSERNAGCEGLPEKPNNSYGDFAGTPEHGPKLNVTKQNFHPTVKPLKLMEYLCTLTKTPTGGIVLDPFAGSGTTLLAAKNIGREYIGIEMSPEYHKIIEARLNA